MLLDKPNEIPYLISFYPIIFCFSTLLVTLVFRKYISQWFELVLYHDEDEEEN